MGTDPEQLIGQALRAQVGGPKAASAGVDSHETGGEGTGRFARFSTAQALLLAALIGLVLGMTAGFLVLLTR